jgi:Heterokaryon incompatibility protein (HET)
MPHCQLFRIMSLVSKVNKGRLPFWIDTCCVPREIEQRKKAIRLMNKTYRTAARVLVLDATLQLFKCHRGLDPQKGTWALRIDNLWDAGVDGGNL